MTEEVHDNSIDRESSAGSVLLVEDEATIRNALEKALRAGGFWVRSAGTARAAMEAVSDMAIEVALVDTRLPDANGVELVASIKAVRPDMEIIVMSVIGMMDQAMEAIDKGAFDYVRKPFDRMELVALAAGKAIERRRLRERVEYLEASLTERKSAGAFAGTSPASKQLISELKSLSLSQGHVLIIGAPGSGKELSANVIHNSGPRSRSRIITVNCVDLDPETAADQLFGQIKSSPTGVVQTKSSFFRMAEKGTLLLKEISALPYQLQGQIADALVEGEFYPIGSTLAVKINTRVIGTSSNDLKKLAKDHLAHPELNDAFSEQVKVPALKDRPDDIPEIAASLLERLKNDEGLTVDVEGIDPRAMRLMELYAWPGNVSELKNVIRRAALIAAEKVIKPEDLPKNMRMGLKGWEGVPLSLEAYEKLCYERALKESNGDPIRAALLLKVGKSTVYRKIKEYDIDLKKLS